MQDFVFFNKTRILFGQKAVSKHLPQAISHVGQKILLVYGGGSIKRNGIYDEVLSILKTAGKEVFELAGVMPNPTKAKVEEGADLVREHGIDFILAVGGGSVMDCAKAIGIAAVYQGDWWNDLWMKPGTIDFTPVPVGTIVTMVGTGSEFDGGGVITNTDVNIKTGMIYPEISPDFSIIDPTYTLSVPVRQMRAGGFDAMSHLMEHYFAQPDEDNISDDLCEALLKALIRDLRSAMKDPQNYTARSNIAWASSLALCGIPSAGKHGDYDCHSLEHQIGAYTDCVHGEGLAVIHPVYYKHLLPFAVERFARFARNVWGIDTSAMTTEEAAQAGLKALSDFIAEIGMPRTLRELGVKTREEAETIARTVVTGPGTYHKFTTEEVVQIFDEVF